MSVMNLATAKECIRLCLKKKIPTQLLGPAGIGKTELHEQIYKLDFDEFIVSHAAQMGEVDARGIPIFDLKTGTTRWLPPAEFPKVFKPNRKILWLLDEFNLATTAVHNCMQQLFLPGADGKRRLGEYVLPDECAIATAGNRLVDGVNVTKLSQAMESRLVRFEVEPDLETWIQDYALLHCHHLIVGFAKFKPESMYVPLASRQRGPFPNFRAWKRVSDLLPDMNDRTRLHIVSGIVGDTVATEFESFYPIHMHLPSLTEVELQPKTAKVPPADQPSAMYAIAAAMGRFANKRNFAAYCTYADRLPDEYSVLMATTAVRKDRLDHPDEKDRTIEKTKAYSTWFANHQDVLI